MLREGEGREAGGEPTREAQPGTAVLCRRCSAQLSEPRLAIAIDGRHAHELVNPAGIAFDVRCFSDAPGARPYGDASTFFSWFREHAWRIVVCGNCGVHVGWRFEGASTFFGLIADRIAESS
jgi:hypothetical protein